MKAKCVPDRTGAFISQSIQSSIGEADSLEKTPKGGESGMSDRKANGSRASKPTPLGIIDGSLHIILQSRGRLEQALQRVSCPDSRSRATVTLVKVAPSEQKEATLACRRLIATGETSCHGTPSFAAAPMLNEINHEQ